MTKNYMGERPNKNRRNKPRLKQKPGKLEEYRSSDLDDQTKTDELMSQKHELYFLRQNITT